MCVKCTHFSNTWKLAPPCILFPSVRFGRDTNISTSSGSTMVNILLSKNGDSFFFFICQTEMIKPIRHWRMDTDLVHGMNCLKQKFRIHSVSIEVNSTSISFLLQDPTTQSTGCCEEKMTSFWIVVPFCWLCDPTVLVDRESRHTMSFPNLDPRNVRCPGKHFFA